MERQKPIERPQDGAPFVAVGADNHHVVLVAASETKTVTLTLGVAYARYLASQLWQAADHLAPPKAEAA